MKKGSYYHLVKKLSVRHYRPIVDSTQWLNLLQTKYNIDKKDCSEKHKKNEYFLFAEHISEFDNHGSICKSYQRLFNTDLLTEYTYTNVYDEHCKEVMWSMNYKNDGLNVDFPASILLQPSDLSFTYNENGDMTSIADDKGKSTFEYTYNEQGLWTERFQIANEKCVEIVVREFEYWKTEEDTTESDIKEKEEVESIEAVEEEWKEQEDEDNNDNPHQGCKEDIIVTGEQSIEETIQEEVSNKESTEEPEHMDENDIVGIHVSHKKFGIGIVDSLVSTEDKQLIQVTFKGWQMKKFVFPDAFKKGYLVKI